MAHYQRPHRRCKAQLVCQTLFSPIIGLWSSVSPCTFLIWQVWLFGLEVIQNLADSRFKCRPFISNARVPCRRIFLAVSSFAVTRHFEYEAYVRSVLIIRFRGILANPHQIHRTRSIRAVSPDPAATVCFSQCLCSNCRKSHHTPILHHPMVM